MRTARAPRGRSALGAPRPELTPIPTGGAGLRGRQLRPFGPVSRGEGAGAWPRPVGRLRRGGRTDRVSSLLQVPPSPQVPAPGPLEQPVARGVSGGCGAEPGPTVVPGTTPTCSPPSLAPGLRLPQHCLLPAAGGKALGPSTGSGPQHRGHSPSWALSQPRTATGTPGSWEDFLSGSACPPPTPSSLSPEGVPCERGHWSGHRTVQSAQDSVSWE